MFVLLPHPTTSCPWNVARMASGLRRLAHDLVPHDYVTYRLVEPQVFSF